LEVAPPDRQDLGVSGLSHTTAGQAADHLQVGSRSVPFVVSAFCRVCQLVDDRLPSASPTSAAARESAPGIKWP
jgi:hypothetical protein